MAFKFSSSKNHDIHVLWVHWSVGSNQKMVATLFWTLYIFPPFIIHCDQDPNKTISPPPRLYYGTYVMPKGTMCWRFSWHSATNKSDQWANNFVLICTGNLQFPGHLCYSKHNSLLMLEPRGGVITCLPPPPPWSPAPEHGHGILTCIMCRWIFMFNNETLYY